MDEETKNTLKWVLGGSVAILLLVGAGLWWAWETHLRNLF